MTTLTEADVEQLALDWLVGLGWRTAYGPDSGPDKHNAERPDYSQVVLERRLRDALLRRLISGEGRVLDKARGVTRE